MLRRPRAFVGGMLILYTGMMLFGQSLHHLLGCEHDHDHEFLATHSGSGNATGQAAAGLHVEAADEHVHDADGCPICQFQAQGQLAVAVVGSELRQTVVAAAPLRPSPIVAVFALGVQGPRPPPRV
ncbi:MAG TPA: hypothetical protein VGP63_02385 [Planctomycetaceae bacterium]|nr:hypothetical protein [Planctomycetaceae bacterium]